MDQKLELWGSQEATQYIAQRHLDDETAEILKVIGKTYNMVLSNNLYSKQNEESAWKIGRLQCCVDNSFAVLAGVDLVEYFHIPHGSTAVAGNPDISTTIGTQNGDYTFFFKNNEN